MKSFLEYKEYLDHQLKHVLIQTDQDLVSFTKFLLNYGKVALKYFPEDIEKLAHKVKAYGIKETELLDYIESVSFKDEMVIITTKDKKTFNFNKFSSSAELLKSNIDTVDLVLLISVTLDNKRQEVFQLFHFANSKKIK